MQLFVNDLTVMDFSYLCPERGMVGESWIVDVLLDGDLNEESMVQDFGKVKKELKALIDDYVDHKLLVPAEHPYCQIERDALDNVRVDFARPTGSIHLFCPAEAYAFVYAGQVDIASVSQYLKEVLAIHLPDNVEQIELTLRPEVIDEPYYHYTHGLKKHDGNCQRIAHGHRSRIKVLLDEQLSLHWQQYWAKRWQDIYIGSHEDVVALQDTQLTLENASDHHVFAYESSQGRFELAIARHESELVNTDSTVECLAQFIAEQTRQQVGAKQAIKVLAFEGVGKGAIAYA